MKIYIVKTEWFSADQGEFPNTAIITHGIYSKKEDALKRYEEIRKNDRSWGFGSETTYMYEATMDEEYTEREIGDELIIDIAKYSKHPNCNSLYCFVYDPDYCIGNPKGLENDLNNKSTDEFKVKVFVRPFE